MTRRANNFNAEEITLLKEIVLKKADIIENKKSNAVTWKSKKECWENIAIEFNSNSLQCRSADMLRKKWDNIKKNIKDKVVGQRKYALGTGGLPSQTPANLTKKELRTKRSGELTADKEDTLLRFRKRSHTAQLTNKVWTELSEDKKTVAKLKAEKLAKDIQLTEALIEESLVRKRNTELQNILLELEIEIKKRE